MKRYWWVFIGLIFGLAACGNIQENYQLAPGEQVDGNRHIVAADAVLDTDSFVNGNLNITASSVMVDGLVNGDLTIIASTIVVGEHARISGDFVYCTSQVDGLQLSEQAKIGGDIVSECNRTITEIGLPASRSQNPLLRLAGNTLYALGFGLVAALCALVMPKRLQIIQQAVRQQPGKTLGFGLLTFFTLLGLTILWGVSLIILVPLILTPVVLGAWLVLLVFSTIGSVAIGQIVGERISRSSQQVPLVSATLGTALLIFILSLCSIIPALSLVTSTLLFVLSVWALGATIITRLGSTLPEGS